MIGSSRLRLHHFLCTLNFQGKGYSLPFINNYLRIKGHLQRFPAQKILIVNSTDSICGACLHKRGGQCEKEELIALLDKRHATSFGFAYGTSITWEKAARRIRERISLPLFHTLCEGCSWKEHGICERNIGSPKQVVPLSIYCNDK